MRLYAISYSHYKMTQLTYQYQKEDKEQGEADHLYLTRQLMVSDTKEHQRKNTQKQNLTFLRLYMTNKDNFLFTYKTTRT